MNACGHLTTHKGLILKRWEELSIAKVPEAKNLSRGILRDHIPQVFDAMCEVLETRKMKSAPEVSKAHGSQRSFATDYSLSEVMTEYTILKNVIFDELSKIKFDDFTDWRLIDTFFDSSISHAVTQFVDLREQELNAVSRSLFNVNTDLETFAAIAAHDLRSPTATILGFVQLLNEEGGPQNEMATKAIATIQKTAGRMLELIDQLLDYAKIGKEHLACKVFPLQVVAEEAKENLTEYLRKAGGKIVIEPMPEYTGDPILFRQLFQNVMANSLKFRDKSRPVVITVSGQQDRSGIHLQIKDNGVGFDPAMSEEIFLPFKRAGNKADTQGSGLGLATVRRIVERHHGKIKAVGIPGKGAEILIELPDRREVKSV